MQNFEIIREKFKLVKQLSHGKKGFVILGSTRVGKSTLYLLLQNQTLKIKKKDKRLSGFILEPEDQQYKNIISDKNKSHTQLPNIIHFDKKKDIYLIDMPGTKDLDYQKRIMNSIYIRQAIMKMQQVHFLILTQIDNQNSFHEMQITMFEQIMKILPKSKQYITICVNRIRNQITQETNKQLKQNISNIFTKKNQRLLQYYSHALKQSSQIFSIRYPSENMLDQIFNCDQKMRKYLYLAKYQQIKQCQITPADISDGLKKGNSFSQTLQTIQKFIFEEMQIIIQKIKQIINFFVQFITNYKNNENQKQEIWQSKNYKMLQFFYYIYSQLQNIYENDNIQSNLIAFRNFFETLLKYISLLNGQNKKFQSLCQLTCDKLYEVYCFINFFNGNKKVKDKIKSFQSQFADKFYQIQSTLQKFSSKIQFKEIQLFVQFHFFIIQINQSQFFIKNLDLKIQKNYVLKLQKVIQLLEKLFPYIFHQNKNIEYYQNYMIQNFYQILQNKKNQLKKNFQFQIDIKQNNLQQLYQKLKHNQEKNFSQKHKKMLIKKLFQEWKEKDSKSRDPEKGIQYCQMLHYNISKYQILKQIPRKQRNYWIFLKWADKYLNEKKFEKANQLYDYAWECNQNFNQQKQKEIISKKRQINKYFQIQNVET